MGVGDTVLWWQVKVSMFSQHFCDNREQNLNYSEKKKKIQFITSLTSVFFRLGSETVVPVDRRGGPRTLATCEFVLLLLLERENRHFKLSCLWGISPKLKAILYLLYQYLTEGLCLYVAAGERWGLLSHCGPQLGSYWSYSRPLICKYDVRRLS